MIGFNYFELIKIRSYGASLLPNIWTASGQERAVGKCMQTDCNIMVRIYCGLCDTADIMCVAASSFDPECACSSDILQTTAAYVVCVVAIGRRFFGWEVNRVIKVHLH